MNGSELTEEERAWLTWAMQLAFDVMCSGDGFEQDDWDALAKFQRLARGEES